MRLFLTGLSLLLVALLGFVLAAPFLVDSNRHRAWIAQKIANEIGAPVTIGSIERLRFLPIPMLGLGDVTVGASEHGVMISLKRADLELDLPSLLRREARIIKLDMVEPSFVVDRDRLTSMRFGSLPVERLSRVAIGKWRIIDGHLRVKVATQPDFVATATVSGDADSLIGPWRASGRITMLDQVFQGRVSLGRFDPAGQIPARFVLENEAVMAFLTLDGMFDLNTDGPFYAAALKASGHLDWPLRYTDAQAPWRVSAKAELDGNHLNLKDMEVEAGPEGQSLKAEGQGVFMLAERHGALSLAIRQADLDRVLARQDRQETGSPDLNGIMRRLIWPLGATLDVKLDVATILAGGEAFGPASLDLRLLQRETHLRGLDLVLPGAGTARLNGRFSQADSRARFDGRLQIMTQSVRTMQWLLPIVSGRAGNERPIHERPGWRRLAADAALDIQADALDISSLDLRLDETMLSGSLRYEPRMLSDPARALLFAKLSAETLDLDLVQHLTQLLWPQGMRFPALTLDIAAKRLSAKSLPVDAIGASRLKIISNADGWDLIGLDVSGGGGLRASGSGHMSEKGGQMRLSIESQQVSTLVPLLRPFLPSGKIDAISARAQVLSPARLGLTLERLAGTGRMRIALDGMLDTSRIVATLIGHMDETYRSESVDLALTSPDGARLLRQIGFEALPWPGAGPGNLMLNHDGKTWKGSLEALGVGLAASGQIGAGLLPWLSGDFDLRGRDLSTLLAVMGFGLADPLKPLPVDMKGKLEWSLGGLRLDEMSGHLAGTAISGRLLLKSDAERLLSGQIAASEIDAIRVLERLILPSQSVVGPGRWPSGRFLPAPIWPIALAIDVATPRLSIGEGVTLTDAAARISLRENMFEAGGFAARLDAGRLEGRLRIRRDGGLAMLDGRVQASDLALQPFGFEAGTGNVSLDWGTNGDSVARLVTNLAGAGELRLRGVTLSRLDPAAIGRVADIKPMPATPDALRQGLEKELAAASFPVSLATMPVSLAQGSARIGPFSSLADGARLAGQAVFDLKSWRFEGRSFLETGQEAEKAEPLAIGLAYEGAPGAIRRSIDVTGLFTLLTTQAVKRELERVEALESDARERAMFNRRLRVEREQRREAEERAALEARRRAEQAAQERRRQSPEAEPTSALQRPVLSPPLNIQPPLAPAN